MVLIGFWVITQTLYSARPYDVLERKK